MKVLVATAMYPTEDRPFFGTFVRTQVESLRKIGVDAEPFVLAGRSRKMMYAQAVPALRRRLERGDVDVVHAHYSYVGAVARMQRRVPVVLTFHGDDLLGTVGADGETASWSRAVARAGKLLASQVDAVIVQTAQMAHILRSVPNVHVLPHEVDLELFAVTPRSEARAQLGLDPDRPYLLFAASPDVAVKRFPLARDAVELVRSAGAEAELLVVHREPQDRLALYMNACDALVFTSFQEGSPNVIKQAMACNLPIVSTDVGDVAEVIAGTDGCVVVEPTPGAVAAGLEQVLARGGRTNGRAEVSHLSCEAVASRLAVLYDEVVGRDASRRMLRAA
jgi:teichuronic acid biosynthesis glycosyltransferase TuaC